MKQIEALHKEKSCLKGRTFRVTGDPRWYRRKLVIRCVIVILLIVLGFVYLSSIATDRLRDEIRYIAGYRSTYDFSVRHFPAHAENWRSYLAGFKGKPGINYLEVGVFEGSSFVWVLENILTNPSSKATAIDPFFSDTEEKFRKNVKLSGYESKVLVIKGFSYTELPKLPRNSYDIIYVDADHRAKNVYVDAALSWGLLKNGGVLIFDDYLLNLQYPVDMRPKTAIDAFTAAFVDELDVVHNAYQLVVRKRSGKCPKLYCTEVGNYGYVWPERRLYDLGSGRRVALNEEETVVIESFLHSYVDQRRNKHEGRKLIFSNPAMSRLNEKLKILNERET